MEGVIKKSRLKTERVRCKICGEFFNYLGHVLKHKYSKLQYVIEFYNKDFELKKCGFCNEHDAIPSIKYDNVNKVFNIFYEKNFLCNNIECKNNRKHLNPRSYEYTSIMRKISLDEAKKHIAKTSPFHRDYWETDEEYSKHQARNLEHFIRIYGIEEGNIRYRNFIEKAKIVRQKDYFIKKHGVEKYNKTCKNKGLTLKRFIELYGEDNGNKKHNEWLLKTRSTLENFIKRHGYNEGIKKFYKYKFKISGSLQSYIEKYGNENGIKKYNERQNNRGTNCGNGQSAISIDFFKNLSINTSVSIKSFINDGEKYIKRENGKCFFIDGYIEKFNIAIEFFGDYWHMNPLFFKTGQKIKKFSKFIIPDQIWLHDKHRLYELLNHVNVVIVVWENSYKNFKENVLKTLLDFIEKAKDNKLEKGIYYV